MRRDKLQCLLSSFIANRREVDVTDAVCAQGSVAAEFEDPLRPFEFGGHLRGGYISQPYENIYAPLSAVQTTQVAAVGRQLSQLVVEFSANHPDRSSVRFEKSCMIVTPEEQTLSIPIIRSSSSGKKVIKVTWKTHDKTAVSGTHYVGSSGEITFDEGVAEKTIEIKILQSSSDAIDLRFNVMLSVINDGYDPKPMTVTLKKIDNFYEDEKDVLKNLPFSPPFSIEDIRCVLEDSLTNRTFHMALTHLCSAADSVHLEFALACELSRLCFNRLHCESVLNVLTDFFRTEDIEC